MKGNSIPVTTGGESSLKSVFSWMIATPLLFITIPWAVCNILWRMRQTKYRNTLPGKVVVITGASSGLGEALAHTFYTAGCKVVLAARRRDELERVRNDLLETHSQVPTHPPVVIQIDLSDLKTISDRVDQIIDIFGHVDILINNGGISVRSDVMSSNVDVDLRVMLVNYFGSVAMTKAVLPSMVQRQQGKIVNVSSVQGKFAIPYRSAYSASKHALQAFSDSLRAEVFKDNVQVLTVCPGYINTALSLNALTGTGDKYGVTDQSTASGASPESVSEDILKAVLMNNKDVVLAPLYIRTVQYLRLLFPSVYFWVMQHRAKKLAASIKPIVKQD